MEKKAEFLAQLKKLDAGALAELRRSLSRPPGQSVRVFPLVERFVPRDREEQRAAYYLVAALFALYHREGDFSQAEEDSPQPERPKSLGWSIGRVRNQDGQRPPGLEARFTHLLDAAWNELPQPLRQMVGLLRSSAIPIEWGQLLDDLLRWSFWDRKVQIRWAGDFYLSVDEPVETEEPKGALS